MDVQWSTVPREPEHPTPSAARRHASASSNTLAGEVFGLVPLLFELEFLVDSHGIPDQSAVDLSMRELAMSQARQIEQQAAKALGGWPPGGTEQCSQAGDRGAREGGIGSSSLRADIESPR